VRAIRSVIAGGSGSFKSSGIVLCVPQNRCCRV
jgi:hypothetical protein